ncbi:MAG: hypothetical protein QM479_07950, partial [Pseudomonadota bacterium]
MFDEGYRVESSNTEPSVPIQLKILHYIKQIKIQIVVLFLATLLAYSSSFNVPFYLDDYHSIVENPIIHDISTMFEKRNFQIMRLTGTYSLATNYAIHQTSVFGYHLINILIHFLTGLAVFFLIRALLLAQKYKCTEMKLSENYLLYLPFFSALLFLLHPLQTQAITYIVQRHASLAALFYISAMAGYVYARLYHSMGNKDGRPWLFYFIGAVFAILALFSKEHTVTLVGAIFLIEILFFQTFSAKKVFIWAASGLLLTVILALSLHYFMGVSFELIDRYTHTADVKHISRLEYFSTQMLVLWTYIKLFFIPLGLHLDYDVTLQKSIFNISVIIALMGHIAILVGSLFFARQKPLLTFAVFFYYLAHSVESGVIPILDLAFEHRSYLPNLGLTILVAWLLVTSFELIKNKLAAIIIISLLFFVLAGLTIQRNNQWANPIAFYQNEATLSPNKERVWAELGKVYLQDKQFNKALQAFGQALNLSKEGNTINALPTTFLNTYIALFHAKQLKKAQYFESIMPINSLTIHDRSVFYFIQGNRLVINKEYLKAVKSYQQAVQLNPGNLDAKANLAALYIQS